MIQVVQPLSSLLSVECKHVKEAVRKRRVQEGIYEDMNCKLMCRKFFPHKFTDLRLAPYNAWPLAGTNPQSQS